MKNVIGVLTSVVLVAGAFALPAVNVSAAASFNPHASHALHSDHQPMDAVAQEAMDEKMMRLKAEADHFHQIAVTEAIRKNQKMFSMQEIVDASASELGLSEVEFMILKGKVQETISFFNGLLVSSPQTQNMTLKEHREMTHRVAEELKKKYTLVEIQWQPEKETGETGIVMEPGDHQGVIVGPDPSGQVQGCIDNNGWGYKYFIASDCYKAYYNYKVCLLDQTSSFMGNDRFCKYGVNNCSPLIGHPSYWHDDGWYSG